MSLDRLIQSNAELQYPSVKPELDLNLTRKTLKGIDPAYSFTRNSSATYIGPDGLIKTAGINQPRFEYDLETGEYKGLLVEESRTNINPNSFNSGARLGSPRNTAGSLVYNVLDPFGTYGGVVEVTLIQAPNPSYYVWNRGSGYFSTVAGEKISYSFFFNRGTLSNLDQTARPSERVVAFQCFSPYDFQQQVISESYLNNQVQLKNGWVYCKGTFTAAVTGNYNLYVQLASFQISQYVGLSGTFYFTGLQVERGSSTTSYIPTSGSAVTRQPDQLVLNKTLNTQGTFFIESNPSQGIPLVAGDASPTLSISQPTNQYTKSVLYYNNNRTLRMASDDSVSFQSPVITQNINKVSLGFDRFSNLSYINGYLKKFSYYSSPLSEDNLRALTGNKNSITRSTRFGGISAIGGIVSEIIQNGISYRVHTFTTVGANELIIENGGEVEYLIVGGGGGGSRNLGFSGPRGGGGGAGGLLKYINGESGNTDTSPLLLPEGSYSIVVGNGGEASQNRTDTSTGKNGGFSSIGDILTALGGRHGTIDSPSREGPEGGSGGGGNIANGSSGTSPQGNNGGRGDDLPVSSGGGGGGAGQAGFDYPSGRGGDGKESSISGGSYFYAGGGSGNISLPGGAGGGGGAGTSIHGTDGTGGGGRAGNTSNSAGNGGSGIVIVRYPIGVA